MRLFMLLLLSCCLGCTYRVVEYKGVKYSHKSWLTSQSFGKLGVTILPDGTAEVELENYANDQVSALREANKLVENLNNLRKP